MKFIFLLMIGALVALSAPAQTPDETAVRATISQLFVGMSKADSLRLKPLFTDGAQLQTVQNKQGIVSVNESPIAGFITSVGNAKAGVLDERLGTYTVHIDGDLATAFTPYSFYYNGQQKHCGANAFTLVRLGNNWKIHNIIDTRRGCN